MSWKCLCRLCEIGVGGDFGLCYFGFRFGFGILDKLEKPMMEGYFGDFGWFWVKVDLWMFWRK
jgi:hypothetical protein